MDASEAILTRRSVRAFTADPVDEADVEAVLRAAMSAPSAFNERPWHFIVVRDAGMREELSRISEFSGPIARAQVGVVVVGDTTALKRPGSVYWLIDCSAAIENALLMAHAIGLGAVWLGIHPTPERIDAARRLLGLPDHVEPLGMVALGHPTERRATAGDRFDAGRVHRERW